MDRKGKEMKKAAHAFQRERLGGGERKKAAYRL